MRFKFFGMPRKWMIFLVFILARHFVLLTEAQSFELVWVLTSSEGYFEKDWVKELLEGHTYQERDSLALGNLQQDTILVVSANSPLSWKQIRDLEKCKERGIHLGVFHLSDEDYTANCSWYSKVDFVFRQYFHRKFVKMDHVQFIPLGCKKGFRINQREEDLKTFSDRAFAWSFIGQIVKSNRLTMLKYLKRLKENFYCHYNKGFNTSDCLGVDDYQNVLFETKFSPSPLGFCNPDTFRLYESLESGCIPIVEDPDLNYFNALYQNPPFIVVQKWQDLPKIIKPFLQDKVFAEAKRLECFRWWKEEKSRVKKKIAERIQRAFCETPT